MERPASKCGAGRIVAFCYCRCNVNSEENESSQSGNGAAPPSRGESTGELPIL